MVGHVAGRFAHDAAVAGYDQMTRGTVRAAPGRLGRARWDHGSGVLEVDGTLARPGMDRVLFYPAQKYGMPMIEAVGFNEVRVVPGPGDNIYLVAATAAATWSRCTPRRRSRPHERRRE